MRSLFLVVLCSCGGLGAYSEGAGICLGKACGTGDDTDVGGGVTPDGEDCTDGVDNNGDNVEDCDDPACEGVCDADHDGFIAVARGGPDCDDTTTAIRPDASEICDGIDNDCDRLIDDDDDVVVGATIWYDDADDDGYGDPNLFAARCDPGDAQVVQLGGDCDPRSSAVNPGASERACDGVDNDCDGATPDSRDADNDGADSCDDCDDNDRAVHPGAPDACGDGADTNCDGFECSTFSDDFESGALGAAWTSSGAARWAVDSSRVHAGAWAARSGNISDNQLSTLEITLSYASSGTISFWHKESTESGYDYLLFLVDGTEQARWSGNNVWQQEAWRIPAGVHTFKWRYDKDSSRSDNDDTVYLDDVRADGSVP
ncbi:MAG TPA: putative metal-binding motif-containing protein [Myxococcota bacterium]|nr:putative metal-binding motif-containing protein [Myxococcota bacterium]